MKLNRTIIILTVLITSTILVNAQQALTSSGGNAEGENGSISYSIGQNFVSTNINESGSLSEGVLQPYEIYVINGVHQTGIDLNISAYPNPTTNYLMLEIANSMADDLRLAIYDINGRLLDVQNDLLPQTKVIMQHYKNGTYILKVIHSTRDIKTFKIVKH